MNIGFRALAAAALAVLASGGQVSAGPEAERPAAASPSLFERAFDRRDYQRRSRTLDHRAEAAEREVARARAAAAEARRDVQLPAPALPAIAPLSSLHSEDALADRRRAERRADVERMQQFLDAGTRADSAKLRSEIANARSVRTRQVIRGLDRLYAGAAAGRAMLGDDAAPLRAPLIQTPRVSMD